MLNRIDSVPSIDELTVPSGNHPETLRGNRRGGQYRICFAWGETGYRAVEVTDYHQEGVVIPAQNGLHQYQRSRSASPGAGRGTLLPDEDFHPSPRHNYARLKAGDRFFSQAGIPHPG